MTDATAGTGASAGPPRRRGMRALLPFLLALVLGGAGFYATYAGLVPLPPLGGRDAHGAEPLPSIAFVPVDPLVISLGAAAEGRHLRFRAQLEVAQPHAGDVAALLPRILDVMNGYLRALDPGVLEEPTALVRVRAQLLRRVQMVTGEGRVRDLLISEFVLN